MLLAVLLAPPALPQDLPDPGRRLSKQEQDEDPDKRLLRQASPQRSDVFRERKRDPELCERARLNKQVSCGLPHSHKSRSLQCTEAHLFVDQNC